jgi:hypothetical protein
MHSQKTNRILVGDENVGKVRQDTLMSTRSGGGLESLEVFRAAQVRKAQFRCEHRCSLDDSRSNVAGGDRRT